MPDENRDHPIPDPEWEAFLAELNGSTDQSHDTRLRDDAPEEKQPIALDFVREEVKKLSLLQLKIVDLIKVNPSSSENLVALNIETDTIEISNVHLTVPNKYKIHLECNRNKSSEGKKLDPSDPNYSPRISLSIVAPNPSNIDSQTFEFYENGEYNYLVVNSNTLSASRKQIKPADIELAGMALQTLLTELTPKDNPKAE